MSPDGLVQPLEVLVGGKHQEGFGSEVFQVWRSVMSFVLISRNGAAYRRQVAPRSAADVTVLRDRSAGHVEAVKDVRPLTVSSVW